MITTADFSSLTGDLQSIYNEVSSTKLAKMIGPTFFNVSDTNRKTHEHLILHGVAGIEDVSEGQDFPRVTTEQGDTITWTQRHYGVTVPITKDMRKFDLHNQINSVVRSITEDSWDKIEQDYADTFLYGWDTSFTNVYGKSTASVGPDGACLFSAAHSTPLNDTAFNNLITGNPVLSRSAIVTTRKTALVHKDPNGHIKPILLDTLVVAPSNEDLARRIVESELISGSANNDMNPLKGSLKIVVWPYLEARSDGTDTSAYWFMLSSGKVKESLHSLFAERPSLDAPEVVYANKNWDYTLDYYYTNGIGFPAFVWGSNGTGS